MINKKSLKKNKLDLEYHKYTQLLNGTFIFATTGLLGFIASFIWTPTKLVVGLIISLIILILSYYSYIKVNKKLNLIIQEIENL